MRGFGVRAWWLAAAAVLAEVALGVGSASAGGGVTIDAACSPAEVRPNTFVLMTCWAETTNAGDAAVEDARIQMVAPAQLRIAIPHHFDQRLDGQLLPNQPNGVDVALGDLAPGQTRTLTVRFITTADSPGDYGVDFQLLGGGRVAALRTARFTATSAATVPGTDLEIELALLDEVPSLPPPLDFLAAPLPTAAYEIRLINRSSATITDLSIEERFTGDVTAVALDPPPVALDDDLGLARWDLPAFGRTNLGPGEELRVRATFASATPGSCTYVLPLAIAVATAAGSAQADEYAAAPPPGVPVGTCDVVDDEGHACFLFRGFAPEYPAPCRLHTDPCIPAAPNLQFPVPENGVVCLTLPQTEPGRPEPTPTATPPPATRLPGLGTAEASASGRPRALVTLLVAGALVTAAAGLRLRRPRL